MRVAITGATGVLGRRLVEAFDDAGHEVLGLVRDDVGAATVEAHGGTPNRGDVLDRSSLADVVADVDVAVHAATAIPTETKPDPEAWARNDRIRVEGMRNLLAAGDDLDRVLFPSVVWVARQPDGGRYDETAPRHPDRSTAGAAEVERLLLEGEIGPAATVLRLGLFYSHDDATTRTLASNLLSGRQPIVGRGLLGRRCGALSRIHPTDAAAAFVAAVEAEVSGLFHVVDEEPVGLDDFLVALADRLDASKPGPRLPAWLARFLLGPTATDLISRPMPTDATRFREATGWEPTLPTYREGLDRVVERWRAAGTVERDDGAVRWVEE
ncbi:MAG: NAD-dependent epimerase/dehydratase family protein [Halobacteriales archaeon]